ncbi:hypothetical protein [Streptomyces sp. AK02-04a]|uniref:hypothetical protein n=1 Tax=Streptomyces sp. AK02-04a TaxID=3028649 RepID=UPI0029AFBF4C|nr:hypothetical protein [Streptomyces sp. AK02-04a]MDX3763457.1 hypothetical protein [Streptomyces sp. AK02-04a]
MLRVEEAASALGADAKPREIADRLREQRRPLVAEPYIRTALSRAARKPQDEAPTPMELASAVALNYAPLASSSPHSA